MIRQKFIVNRRYWKVYVYYNVTKSNTYEILDKLKEVGFANSYIKSAYTILFTNKPNEGFTQSNIINKTSVVVIKKCSNASEFVNSFVHEIGHLSKHIALSYNLDLTGEEVNYISGDIGQEMYKACHTLMCDCCNKY